MKVNTAAILSIAILSACSAAADGDRAWISKIRRDHPRMFFNADTWPAVKARLSESQYAKEHYERMVKACDGYPDNPVCDGFGPVTTPPTTPIPPIRDWGGEAARCAFVWRATGERKYLEKAKAMLLSSVAAYGEAFKNRRAVHWYSSRRILALCAYDWIHEALTDDERRAIIVPFVRYIEDIQPGPGRPFIVRRNKGDYISGFYGVPSLLW